MVDKALCKNKNNMKHKESFKLICSKGTMKLEKQFCDDNRIFLSLAPIIIQLPQAIFPVSYILFVKVATYIYFDSHILNPVQDKQVSLINTTNM